MTIVIQIGGKGLWKYKITLHKLEGLGDQRNEDRWNLDMEFLSASLAYG